MPKQLQSNYTWPTGYVQDVVSVPPGLVRLPFIYGVSNTQTPTQVEVAAADRMTLTGTSGQSWTWDTPDNQYLFVLIPRQFPRVNTFTILNFPVSFPKTPTPYFVDGIRGVYDLHVSEFRQNGVGISASIT